MKTSDRFLIIANIDKKIGRMLACLAFFVMASTQFSWAQTPYVIVEGSTHNFKVAPAYAESNLAWGMYYDTNNMNKLADDSYLIPNNSISDISLTINDVDRINSELVFLVVTETAPNGCSTSRALPVLIEPNNMFLEFASAETQDCYSMGDYYAPLRVGLNFNYKMPSADYKPIPESRFPLKVKYTIRDITHSGPVLEGNNGEELTIAYSEANDYFLLIKDAVGSATETVEYELTITSVTDKFLAEVKPNKAGEPDADIRLQIRIINHLPQSGNMNMAMAYHVVEMP